MAAAARSHSIRAFAKEHHVVRHTSSTAHMAESEDQDELPIMLGGVQVGTELPESRGRTASPRPVVVTDIQVPFGSLVVFILKCALASVPAILVLAIVGQLLARVLSVL